MKVIKINESQKKRLFEAYREGFSFEELSVLANNAFSDWNDWRLQYDYCIKWLGEPDGKGSSRCVFTLNDNYVLKLAYEKRAAGIVQNHIEYNIFKETNSPLLPKILYCDENFTYLVVENVLPIKMEDFEYILGMTYNGFYQQHSKKEPISQSKEGDIKIGFNDYFKNLKDYHENDNECSVMDIIDYIVDKYVSNEFGRIQYYENYISNNIWLKELKELVIKTKMTDLHFNNFGIVNRDGKPMIVVLDSGCNKEIYKRYYKNGQDTI
jgi:hypothetical protein